ncbi:MAG: sodium/calcium exchanger protein [Acidimicrobiia bacterium]|nr:sodium/calcium exchanger protein [Acidimicrobiia bacterium]
MSGLATWQLTAVFLVSAAVLVRSGFDLARNADEIVARTRLTAVFVGGLFMAVATSLPEAVTGVAATLEGSPDLAVGDLFGSSMANMAILALLDLAYRGRVWPSVGLDHARVGSLAIVLTGLAVLGVLDPEMLQIGPVGLMPLAIAGIYVAALAWFRRSPSSLRALRPTGPSDRPGRVRATLRASGRAIRAEKLVARPATPWGESRCASAWRRS